MARTISLLRDRGGPVSLRGLNSKLENSTVYTLADLEAWTAPGTSLAVLGHPIKHSISPAMQNAALGELARTDARFADWRALDDARLEFPSPCPELIACDPRRGFRPDQAVALRTWLDAKE